MSTTHVETLQKSFDSLRNEMSETVRKMKDAMAVNQASVDGVRNVLTGNANALAGWNDRAQHHVQSRSGLRTKSLGKEFAEYLNDAWTVDAMPVTGVPDAHVKKQAAMDRIINKGGGRITKALAEGSGAGGGFLVPPEYSKQLLMLAAEKSFMRDRCTVMPMSSRELNIPTYDQTITPTTGSSATFAGIVGTWNPEGVTFSNTQPAFRQNKLVARDLTMYTIVNNQLLDDNAYGLEQLLVTMFRDAMAWFYDYYILRGNGFDEPLGVLTSGATYSESRSGGGSTFTPDDAAEMYSRLLSDAEAPLWVMHRSVIAQLIKFGNAVNTNVVGSWMPTGGGKGSYTDSPPTTLLGIPAFFTEKLPNLGTAGDVMLIDAAKVIIGDRMQIQIESSREHLFSTNQTAWRVIARWDSQPWLNTTYTTADGTFTQGMAVALAA